MDAAILNLPSLWGFLHRGFSRERSFSPIWRERIQELSSRHRFSIFPAPTHERWVRDQVLLSPDFYTSVCRPRLETASGSIQGKEAWVMTRILAEGAPELAGTIRERMARPGPEEGFSRAYLEAFTAWRRLEEVMAGAFPRALGFFPSGREAGLGPSLGDLGAGAEGTLELVDHLHPPGFFQEVAESSPRVLFLVADYPKALPLAVAYGMRLRALLPQTFFVLLQSEGGIYSSFAQVLPQLRRASTLFELFDGATVFKDIQDLTLCQIVEKVNGGAASLAGTENLVARGEGGIFYREPDTGTVSEYLRESHLADLWTELENGAGPQGLGEGSPHREIATIWAAKQTCYWDRCHFCPTSVQSWIKKDPFLLRRAEETAECLIRLREEGVEMTFVGREVVPPAVVRDVVAGLKDHPDPPIWSFEGKFETLYDEAFIPDLARAGCRGIIFGLESPSDGLNEAMDKHAPGISVARIEEIIAAMDAAGIAVHVNTIVDLPGSTRESLEVHKAWLGDMFHRHRFFHFNANTLDLLPGSRLSESPEDYGFTVESEGDRLPTALPYLREVELGSKKSLKNEIWSAVFGSPWHGGSLLDLLHALYHEGACLAFWDAAHGRNFFKTIQEEIQPYLKPGKLRLGLPESVQVVGSERGEKTGHWLVDVGGSSGWVRLPPRLWQILSLCIDEGFSLDVAADSLMPHLSPERRDALHQSVARLLARGLLVTSED